MKLVVVIPAQNEEETIGECLDLIPKQIKGINEIVKIVWDDGSDDKTVEIARKHGALVFSNNGKKRLAYTFQKAVGKVLELGADIMVNIDADLQFNPKQIPDLVKPILENKAQFVAADRFTDRDTGKYKRPENMPIGKYYGNRLGAKVVGILTSSNFNDVTCGFRAYNRDALLAININSKYTYTQESFQVLASKKFNIASVPVEIKYYPGRKSRVVKSFISFLFGSALNILKAFRDQAPLTFFMIMGLVPFVLGFILDGFVAVYWLQNGSITPYKAVGFLGLYLVSIGFILWIVGVFADMLDRVLNNQEKTLTLLKEIRYGK